MESFLLAIGPANLGIALGLLTLLITFLIVGRVQLSKVIGDVSLFKDMFNDFRKDINLWKANCTTTANCEACGKKDFTENMVKLNKVEYYKAFGYEFHPSRCVGWGGFYDCYSNPYLSKEGERLIHCDKSAVIFVHPECNKTEADHKTVKAGLKLVKAKKKPGPKKGSKRNKK